MLSLCQFKNILGVPDKGVHSIRFMNIAIIDVLMTIFAAIILSYIFNESFICICPVLFILGIVLHRIFCVDTTVNKFLEKYII